MISAGKRGQSPAGTVPASKATAPARNGLSPKGIVPPRKSQRGYLLVTVIITLFLLASIAVLLSNDSAISANTSSKELDVARAEYVAAAGLQTALWRAQNNACMGDITIPDTALGNDTYSATITGASAGTLFELAADQDAWIRNDMPTVNNGKAATNHVRQETGKVEQALTRFDLSKLPAKGQILSAVAWFNLKVLKEHPEGPISVHEIAADWSETAVTWDSFAGAYRSAVVGMIPAQDTGNVWVGVNITGLVQAWVNGQPNHGILMESSAEGVRAEYLSREDGTNPPRLDVVVGNGPASPVTIKAQGKLDNGVGRTLKDKIAVAYQPATFMVLQPGSEGKDGGVRSSQSTDNFGVAKEITVSGGADPEHLLIQFPTDRIPGGSHIISARLEVYLNWLSSSDPAAEFSVHRMTQSWTEGSGDNWNPGDGANWKTSDGSQTWDWQTNHDIATAVDATLVDPSFSGWHSWDVSSLVQQWTTGEQANNGVVIKGNASAQKAWFRSSDWTDSSQHPRLIVEYACECGTPCMAPQGTGKIALIGDDNSPDPDDQLKIEIFKSWGYDVDFYQDRDSDTINWSAYDVAYVSETSIGNDVSANLASVTIGVVNEEPRLYNDLRLANGDTEHVGSSIELTDTSHYITAIFQPGPLSIYTGGMEILTANTPLAAGLQTLGEFGGATTLAAIDTGAQTTSGTAAGRRVTLPLGQHFAAGFDWTNLNQNAHLLVHRAIDWAMNKKYGLRILLVVGIDTALQTRDTARRDLFESWGHTVTIIDDEATLGEFDAAAALNDVVYVAGTVVDGRLGDKLVKSTLGIVNEVGGQLDNLGFHGNAAAGNILADSFTATAAGHYITEPFGGNAVNHFTTQLVMPAAYAPLAPYLGRVAEIGALTWAIPVLDTGAARWDGELSAGRRVNLPFGEAEISQVTDDGQTLMKRSIEWAAGANTTATPLLLVVADAASPSTSESDRKSLIESWGYEVTLISDHASQAEFDAALANVDVAYITGSVSSTAVGTKLTGATVGVLSEDIGLVGELGIAQPSFLKRNSQSIEIFDNTHYVTSGFSLGTLQLYSYVPGIWTVTGLYAPGLQVLAGTEASGSSFPPGLALLEAGAELWGGGSAAGRRVQMPWSEGSFDINALNADGLTIFRRAIEWATGIQSGPVAHWKLDETAGLTAVDSVGGHDGTLVMGETWTTGQIVGGLDFDGSNDYVDLTSDAGLTDIFDGGATVTGWIYPRSWGESDNGRILDKASQVSGDRDGWMIGLRGATPALQFAQGFTGVRGFWRSDDGTVSLDRWTHFAVVYDASSVSNDAKIYLDGIEQSPLVEITPTGSIATDAGIALRMGNYAQDTSRTFDGIIDDVRIYDRMLNDTEIAALAIPASKAPLAHWKLDETSGTTAVDTVGGHDGTLVNGPAWETGHLDGALNFDGSNDFVNVPHDENLSLTDAMTLTAWINASSFGASYQTILAKDGGGAGSNYWFGTWQQLPVFGFFSGGLFREVFNPSFELQPDAWYHLAASFDNATGDTNLYVDGTLVQNGNLGYNPTAVTADLRMGRSPDGERWRGKLDDVRIYDEVLSASTIATLASAGGGSGGGGGGGGSCNGPFTDTFDAVNYSGGSANWATNWQETGETTSPSGGDIRIDDDTSDYQLLVRDDGQTVWREADLSNATSATLSFIYRRQSLSGSGDYVAVDVSYDGGNNWAELDRFTGTATDSSYLPYNKALDSNSLSDSTRIRFRTPTSGMSNNTKVWFDNIEITCAP